MSEQNTVPGKYIDVEPIDYTFENLYLLLCDTNTNKQLFKDILHEYHYFTTYRNNQKEWLIVNGRELSKNMIQPIPDKMEVPENLIGIISLANSFAPKMKARDDYLTEKLGSWDYKLLGEESRYQLLPWRRKPNATSKVMSLFFKVVRKTSNYRYLQAFVDAQNYEGIGYIAAGWQYVGMTKNGQRKIFVRILYTEDLLTINKAVNKKDTEDF